MANNADIAKAVLETILDIKIDHVECVNAQKILNYTFDEKYVRLDVYLRDGSGISYDLEMETAGSHSRLRLLPIRSRLYGSMLDAEEYPEGTDYQNIRGMYVIWICLNDPFGYGLAKYTVKPVCIENHNVPANTGVTHIYLNCKPTICNVSDELMGLLSYIQDRHNCETALVQRIDQLVVKINQDKDWRNWVMTLERKLNDERMFSRIEGREEGLEEGREEGREERETELIESMVLHGLDDTLIVSIAKDVAPERVAMIRRQITA